MRRRQETIILICKSILFILFNTLNVVHAQPWNQNNNYFRHRQHTACSLDDQISPSSLSSTYYDSATRQCNACPNGSSFDRTMQSCRCVPGTHVPIFTADESANAQRYPSPFGQNMLRCINCTAMKMMPSLVTAVPTASLTLQPPPTLPKCIPCGRLTDALWRKAAVKSEIINKYQNVTFTGSDGVQVNITPQQQFLLSNVLCQARYALTRNDLSSEESAAAVETTQEPYDPWDTVNQSVFDLEHHALRDSEWNEETGRCECADAGWVPTDSIGSVHLGMWLCAPCDTTLKTSDDNVQALSGSDVCVSCLDRELQQSSDFVVGNVDGEKDDVRSVCSECQEAGAVRSETTDGTFCYPPSNVKELFGNTWTAVGDDTVASLNIDDTGREGPSVTSYYVANARSAATSCALSYNATACSRLANMCVLSHYSETAESCRLYLHLLNTLITSYPACSAYLRMEREVSTGCDLIQIPPLPRLIYFGSSNSILRRIVPHLKLALRPRPQEISSTKSYYYTHRLRFVVSVYDVHGKYRGDRMVTTELQQCEILTSDALDFFSVGGNRKRECEISLLWLIADSASADTMEFYELFLDVGPVLISTNEKGEKNYTHKLVPIPVLTSHSNKNIDPQSVDDGVLYRSASSSVTAPNPDAFKRRFYVFDTLGGRVSKASGETPPDFITYARRITLMVNLADSRTEGSQDERDSALLYPLLIVQYASAITTDLGIKLQRSRTGADSPGKESYTDMLLQRSISTKVAQGLQISPPSPLRRAESRVIFLKSGDYVRNSLRTTVIVICSVLTLTAMLKTYGWMRRQQDLSLGGMSFLRFFLFYFDHVANCFLVMIVLSSWIMYIFFRYQVSVEYVLPAERLDYIFIPLYVGVCLKAFPLFYNVFQQTVADIFVMDWEKSKGTMLRSHKETSVSMWRSTFIANEFNEMQTGIRRWNVLLNMLVVAAILEGTGLIEASRSVPVFGSTEGISNIDAVYDPILRLAVSSFFWLVVGIGFFVIRWGIFYRFLAVHPLQSFVDLCSVSNISMMILLEPMWGFYIHGESIHAFADTSIQEFQDQLKQEAAGNMPRRGLGGLSDTQTFEVFIGNILRQFLSLNYWELQQVQMTSAAEKAMEQHPLNQGGSKGPVSTASRTAAVFADQTVPVKGFMTGPLGFLFGKGLGDLCPRSLEIKANINTAFQRCVHKAEKNILSKFGLHALMDFPPNVMYMNGPFAGDSIGADLFFIDDPTNYGKALLYGLDFDIFIFYLLFFLGVDSALQNVIGSLALTYVFELLIVGFRNKAGANNFSIKTMFDDRFFL